MKDNNPIVNMEYPENNSLLNIDLSQIAVSNKSVLTNNNTIYGYKVKNFFDETTLNNINNFNQNNVANESKY